MSGGRLLNRSKRGVLLGSCTWCRLSGVELIETKYYETPLLLCTDCESLYLLSQMGYPGTEHVLAEQGLTDG